MALAVPPANGRKRVKVYELRSNDWFDRGTGFCSGRILNDESRIVVESEDQPDRMLLETKISKDDAYQKQQDTLIVWTESNGTDMALSFQEAEGCAAIWEFVARVRQHLTALSGPDDALSDDAMDSFANPLVLPPPELRNLEDIEHTLRSAASTPHGRDSLAKLAIDEEYILKLIPLVGMAEDLESIEDLHHLCSIMKTLILLNDTQIIEQVVSDGIVDGVMGALEYDPEFPTQKANHRRYLRDGSRYKEVVPIADPAIKRKIHATWRLQYLKDVVLARILDDPTYSVLNSLIYFNQVDIVSHLQANSSFLEELFGIIVSPEVQTKRKKDAVGFIQHCCSIAKTLQAPARATLYANFVQYGLLHVITFALLNKDASTRIAGTDILFAMIDHDPGMVRTHIFKSIGEKQTPLTDTLIELLLVEVDLGVKAQAADALKVLLEPPIAPPVQDGILSANNEFLMKMRPSPAPSQIDAFIQDFYAGSAHKLFQPLKNLETRKSRMPVVTDLTFHEVSLFIHLIEILTFVIRHHNKRSRDFISSNRLTARIAQLLSSPPKHLKLVALKFFRACINLQDPIWIQLMIQNHLFAPILNIVYETMPRDNLLNSACLELFELIKRENIKSIIFYLVENYRERLQQITYVDIFQSLVLRYEQMQEFDPEMDTSLFSQDGSTTTGHVKMNGNQRWQGVKEMDPTEEAYFNTSDDEDDLSVKKKAFSATSPVLRSLVDYPDDDEDDDVMETKILAPRPPSSPAIGLKSESRPASISSSMHSSPPKPSSPLSQSPPERLSEKRRREEDDEEDELGKLSLTKRRSSSVPSISSSIPSSPSHNNSLRRKKGFVMAASKDLSSGGKKIEISLTSKHPTGTNSKRDEGG